MTLTALQSDSAADCPVERALDLIGPKWTLLIIRDAFDGVRRFNEFKASLGISSALLTERLRMLTLQGVLALTPIADSKAHSEYILTDKGKALFQVIAALQHWGDTHVQAKGDRHGAAAATQL